MSKMRLPVRGKGGNSQRVAMDRMLGLSPQYWNSLPWKSVDISKENLGEFQDSVFYGLEELDGNAFINNKLKSQEKAKETNNLEDNNQEDKQMEAEVVVEKKSKKEKKEKKRKLEENVSLESISDETKQANNEKPTKKNKSEKQTIVQPTQEPISSKTVQKPATKPEKQPKKPEKQTEKPMNKSLTKEKKVIPNNKKEEETNEEEYFEDDEEEDDYDDDDEMEVEIIKSSNKPFVFNPQHNDLMDPKSTKNKHKALSQPQKPTNQAILDFATILQTTKLWGDIPLNTLLVDSLMNLDFTTPTPIQTSAIPFINKGKIDIVGVAETGSGKTLAFSLPVINYILTNWDDCQHIQQPIAIIISPTRELAMQISSVLKDIANQLSALSQSQCKLTIGTIVGGMSEEKQRRLLDTSKKPLHIVVATPGRFCEILQDESVLAFRNLSNVKYLIVDEADRIMEEGHFSELHRVFSRIRDHENLVLEGKDIEEILRQRKEGTNEEEMQETKDEDDLEDQELLEQELLNPLDNSTIKLPSKEELLQASEQSKEQLLVQKQVLKQNMSKLTRQTLLFSATALMKVTKYEKQKKLFKLKGTLQGLGSNITLNNDLKQLLSLVAIQTTIRVVDVTQFNTQKKEDNEETKKNTKDNTEDYAVALPKQLQQYEIKVPVEDKDVYIYYFLHKHQGRSLIFANSIKTVRRIDGLLRALGFHARCIHADLPQRQRIKAIETFRSSPNGILVATDVAARGLDIPKVQSVLHYDVARSPQVYVHRSGRTARNNIAGTTISFVSPEDLPHHVAITQHVTGKQDATLPIYKIDLSYLPTLRERVKLAKKIFTQSFVESQSKKERLWVNQSANEADLQLDDWMNDETASDEVVYQEKMSKDALIKARKELQMLLEIPIETQISQPRRHQLKPQETVDWRKRKTGFFVYAK